MFDCVFKADERFIKILGEMKSEIRVLAQRQNDVAKILQAMSNCSSTAAVLLGGPPKLPDGIILPLKTIAQLEALKKRLRQSAEDNNYVVYIHNSSMSLYFSYTYAEFVFTLAYKVKFISHTYYDEFLI